MGHVKAQDAPEDEATAKDLDFLSRCVHAARYQISRGRDAAEQREAFGCEIYPAFDGVLDPLTMACTEAVTTRAAKLGISVEDFDASDDFDSEVMGAVMSAVSEAFWRGLTVGHVMLGGDVSLPYRLFPELIGYGS